MRIEEVPKRPKYRWVVHSTTYGYWRKTKFGRENCGLEEATRYRTELGAYLNWVFHLDNFKLVKIRILEE